LMFSMEARGAESKRTEIPFAVAHDKPLDASERLVEKTADFSKYRVESGLRDWTDWTPGIILGWRYKRFKSSKHAASGLRPETRSQRLRRFSGEPRGMRPGTCFESLILLRLLFCFLCLRRKEGVPVRFGGRLDSRRTSAGLCHRAKRLNFSAITPLVSRVLRSLTT
jgi:hypothetical protein